MSVTNEHGLPQYLYYYADENAIIVSMKKALSLTTTHQAHEL